MIRSALLRLFGGRAQPSTEDAKVEDAKADEGKLVSRRSATFAEAAAEYGRDLTPPPGAPAPVAPHLTPPGGELYSDPFSLGLRDDTDLGWLDFEKRQVVPGFVVSHGDIVADLGCGEGGMSGFCVKAGAHVIMVDTDSAVLDQAVKRASAFSNSGLGGSAEGRVADVNATAIEDASVSHVICTEVLEHVDDPKEAMKELLRIGKPGALYLISVPGAAAERLQKNIAPPPYFEKPNHVRIFETEDLIKLVEESGLVIERRMAYGFFWTLYWLFFWQAGVQFGQGSHPLLDAWALTWHEVLKSSQSDKIRAALHELAPRSIAIVARKPA